MRATDWRVLNALQGVSREAQVTTALRRLRGEVDGLLARLDAGEEER